MIPPKRFFLLVIVLQGMETMITALMKKSPPMHFVAKLHPTAERFHLPSSRLTRLYQRQQTSVTASRDTVRLFGSSSTPPTSTNSNPTAPIPKEHVKSYRIQGASTSPVVPSDNNNNPRKPRPSRGCGPGVTMTTNTHHTFQTDIPKPMGGSDAAPQPVETLLAALIGCTQATALFVGRQLQPRIVIEKMEFDLQAFRDERGALSLPIEQEPTVASRLQEVAGTVRVYSSTTTTTITEEQLELLKEQTELRCPVANMMMASGCQMNLEWVLGDEEN